MDMTSQKQIEANRANAARSTGPRTADGKAVVSLNAVRHGLRAQRIVIEGESQDEFDDFRNRLIARQAPADPLEMLLVDRIAAGFWRLRRTGQIEAQMFDEMRQSLYDETKQAAGPAGDPRIEDALPADYASFPYEDHVECEAEGEDYDPYALPDKIAEVKERCRDFPQLYDNLSECEQSARAAAEIPLERYSIPVFRQYLQGVSELLTEMEGAQQKYQARFDSSIKLLLHLEQSIERRRKPNPGQTLCRDFKGPDILSKLTRYETQIERGLFKAMHELQRLQAKRRNEPVCPPVAVDIDLSGDQLPD